MKSKIIIMLLTIIPTGIYIGFIPSNKIVYYLMLTLLSMYSIYRCKHVNFAALCFLIASVLSILIGDPPPFFKSWERLGLFAILLFAVFPVFDSFNLYKCRSGILKYSLCICALVGISSIFCYFLGINYMTKYYDLSNISINTTGIFSGITIHSMILGVISAIGLIYLFYKATQDKIKIKCKILYFLFCALSFCGVLVSASRISLASAIMGIIAILYLRYNKNIFKLLTILLLIIIILIVAYPVYDQFAIPIIEKQENNIKAGSMFDSRSDRWNHRITEFSKSPFFGIGFSSVDEAYTQEYVERSGSIEPGSSWLSLLSMLGIFGTVPVVYLICVTLKNLYKIYTKHEDAILLISIIAAFLVHLIAEGYILAGGSYLCFLFWLSLGVGYSYSHRYYDKTI